MRNGLIQKIRALRQLYTVMHGCIAYAGTGQFPDPAAREASFALQCSTCVQDIINGRHLLMKELKRISAFFMAMLMMLTVFSAFSAVSAEGEAAGGTQPFGRRRAP